jgi:hypothetical protein
MPRESKCNFGTAVEAYFRLTVLNPLKNLPFVFLFGLVFVGIGFLGVGATTAISSFVPLSENGQMYTMLAVFIFASVLVGVIADWLRNEF